MFGWIEVNGIYIRIREIVSVSDIIETETGKYMFYVQGKKERYYSQTFYSKLMAGIARTRIIYNVAQYESAHTTNRGSLIYLN